MTASTPPPPEVPVEIAGHCLWTDYLAAQRAHERRQRARLPGWRLLWGALAASVIGYSMAALLVDPGWWRWAALSVAVAVVILLRRHVWMPWAWRRMWHRERMLREPFRSTVTAEGFRTETSYGASVSDWSIYEHWIETDDAFLLYVSEAQYGVVPKRLVAGDAGVDRFRRLLAEHVGAAR